MLGLGTLKDWNPPSKAQASTEAPLCCILDPSAMPQWLPQSPEYGWPTAWDSVHFSKDAGSTLLVV